MYFLSSLTFDKVYLIAGILVPGIIIQFIRTQFTTGRGPNPASALLVYFATSTVYFALAISVVEIYFSITQTQKDLGLFAWIIFIFVGPLVAGVLLGLNVRHNLFRRLLQFCNLQVVHGFPTAWDWKFSKMTQQWVLVTLKDGTQFCGFYSSNSFTSSAPNERDIYIQQIYNIDEQNIWTSQGEKGVLISAGEIQSIEFWPYNSKEETDDKK